MAVTHCMDSVLALSVPLVEELLSQIVNFGERAGISGVTEVDHLIHSEERLVASLLSLA